jgi:tripartite-type tricarboxylate transporter receptor subunit TctC
MQGKMFLFVASVAIAATGTAQAEQPYFAGKTIRAVVGLAPGGSTDVFVRSFAELMREYIPGNPTFVVENVPGSGGLVAFDRVYQHGKTDGLTLYWSNWSPITQLTAPESLPIPYHEFEFVGAVGDARIVYSRTDVVPGGLKKSADILRARDLKVGGLNPSSSPDLLLRLSLDLLGVEYDYIPGYGGGSEVFTAMLQGEVQLTSTSLISYRTRNAEFIESGQGKGLYYLVSTNDAGDFAPNPNLGDVQAFPDLYREVHGKPPSGPTWEALNWLGRLTGDMTIVVLAPPDTNDRALSELRAAFKAASDDKEFRDRTVASLGQPYDFLYAEEGASILDSLSTVAPSISHTLKSLIDSAR